MQQHSWNTFAGWPGGPRGSSHSGHNPETSNLAPVLLCTVKALGSQGDSLLQLPKLRVESLMLSAAEGSNPSNRASPAVRASKLLLLLCEACQHHGGAVASVADKLQVVRRLQLRHLSRICAGLMSSNQ